MAKLANLNNGNAPTTMARRFGHLLGHVHYNEMNQRAGRVNFIRPSRPQAFNLRVSPGFKDGVY